MKRLRTVNAAAAEIKAMDEKTAINVWAIRQAIKDGSLPFTMSATRYYVAIEDVLERFGLMEKTK